MPPRPTILTHRWQQELEEQRQCIARQQAEITGLRRTVWMIVKENGGTVTVNRDTKESFPGYDLATIEVVEQPQNGATLILAHGQSTDREGT